MIHTRSMAAFFPFFLLLLLNKQANIYCMSNLGSGKIKMNKTLLCSQAKREMIKPDIIALVLEIEWNLWPGKQHYDLL